MANICSNFLTITGDHDQLEPLHKRLMDQDPKLIATISNFEVSVHCDYCINDLEVIKYDSEKITLDFGSRYMCPIDELCEVSTEYPDLEFKVNFNESGNDYFGETSIQDGSDDTNELEERDYCETYDEFYKEQRAAVTDCSYEDFVKNYTHDNFFDEHPYAMIDHDVVKRIKDDDLPLFISREWVDEDAEAEYKLRLSGGSIKEPKTT
jgi:hypothetical protein